MLLPALLAVTYAADPAGAPPVPPPVRLVADTEVVLACLSEGKALDAEACPAAGTGVSVAPVASGPVKLSTGPLQVRASSDDDLCPWRRFVGSFGPTTTVDLGRSATVMPLPSATYDKIVSDVTGLKKPNLVQLVKIDLDGDAKDEVVFVADSGDLVYDSKGNAQTWAWVGVRKIGADGQLRTLTVFKDMTTYTAAQIGAGEPIPIHRYGKLLGFTDLDGDKKLELVVEDGFYEGAGQIVYRVEDQQIVKLGGTGCGA